MDAAAYCREVEAHLCRRNGGHLVRVIGPAFEMVAGWAARGIPIKIACRGIDRTVERRMAKGPRRRPLRVEFCEADVLDAFDEWSRAVGLGTAGGGAIRQPGSGAGPDAGPEGEAGRTKSGPSLRAHLDRVVTRLTDRVTDGSLTGPLEALAERLMAEIGEMRAASRGARGEARAALVGRLQALDDEMMAAAWEATPADARAAIRREAEEEIVAFRTRMPAEEYARVSDAAASRLLRGRYKLPDLAYPA